eukprot:jgi/Chlat1/225/Chrsp1S03139
MVELADICHQLYTSAELHEKQYLSANDRKHALQNTQQYAVMALTKVTNRVAGTMRGLETQIAALVDTNASSERSINVLTTRLHGCHTQLDQLEWQRLRQKKPSARLPRHAPIHADTWSVEAHTIVATPTEPELFDFSMFDSIGTSLGRAATTPRAGLTGGGTLSMAATAVGNSLLQQPRHDAAEGTGTKARGVPPPPPPAPSTSARLEDGLKPASTVPLPIANTRPPAPPPPPPPPSVLARLDEVTKTDSHVISSTNASNSPRSPPPPPPPPMFVSGKDTKSVPPPPPPPPVLLTRLEGAAKLSPNQPPPPPPPSATLLLGLSSAQGTEESHMSLPSTPHPPTSLPLTTPANPTEAQPAQSGSTHVPPAPSSPQSRNGPVSIAAIAQAAAQAARLQPAAVPPPPPPLPAGPMQKSALLKQSDPAPSLHSKTASSSTSPSAPPPPPPPPPPPQPPAALKLTPSPPPPSPAQLEPTPAAQAGPSPSRPPTSLTPSAPSAAILKSSPSSLRSTPPVPTPLGLAQLTPASLRQVVPLTPASPPQAITAAPSSPKPPPPPPPTLKPVAHVPLSPRWSPQVPAPSLADSLSETQAVAPPPPPPPPPPPRVQLKPATLSSAPQLPPLQPAAVKTAPVIAPVPPLPMQEPVASSQVPQAPLPPPPPPPPPPARTDIFASRGRPPPLPAAIHHGQGTSGLSLASQQSSPRAPSVPLQSEPALVTVTAHAYSSPPPPPPPLLAPAVANLRPTAPMPTSLLQSMPQSPRAAPVQSKPTTSAPPMPPTVPYATPPPPPPPPPPALAAMSATMPQSQTPPAAPVQLKPIPGAGPPPPPPPPPPHTTQASLPLPPQPVALATLRSIGSTPTPMVQHSQSVDAPVQLRPTPIAAPTPPTPPVLAKLKPTVLQPTSTSPPQSPSAPLKPSSNTPAPAQLGAVGAQTPAPPSPRSTEMSSKFSSVAVSAPSTQPAAMLAHAMQSRGQPDGVSLEQIRGVRLRPTTPKQKAAVESGDRSPVSAALRSWQSREASAVPTTPPATTVQTLRSKLLTEASPNNSPKSAQQPHNGIDGYKSTGLTSADLVTSEMELDTTPQQHRVAPVERPTAHNVTVTQQQSPRPDASLRPVGVYGNRAQHDEGQTAETESMPAWAMLKSTTSTLRDTQRAETQTQSHPTSLTHGPTPAVQQAAIAGFAAKQAQAVTSGQKLPSSPNAGFQLPQKGNQQAAAEQHSAGMPAWARLKPTGSPGRDVNKGQPSDDDAEGESETATMPAWAKLKQSSAPSQSSSQDFVVKIQFGNQPMPSSPSRRDTSVAKQSTQADAEDERSKTSSSAGRVTASSTVQQALAGLLNSPRSNPSNSVDRQDKIVSDSPASSPVLRAEAGTSVKTALVSEGNGFVRSQMSAAAKSVQQALAAMQSTTTTSATAPGWNQHASGAKSPTLPPPPPPAPRSPAASLAFKLAASNAQASNILGTSTEVHSVILELPVGHPAHSDSNIGPLS